jgi:hypothetical protein
MSLLFFIEKYSVGKSLNFSNFDSSFGRNIYYIFL